MSAAPAPLARTYGEAQAALAGTIMLAILALAPEGRVEFVRGTFERVRAELERRADWTAAQRRTVLLDLGRHVAAGLSTMPRTAAGAIGRA